MNRAFRRDCRCVIVALLGLACANLLAGAAAAQGPAQDLKLEAARTAFEAMADDGRKAIQEFLIWTGDYNGAVDGSFGKRTFDAIVAFETRGKLKADGIVEAKERAALETAAQKAKQAVNFRLLVDERNGLKLFFPARVLEKSTPAKAGTRLQSADGTVSLETFSHTDQEAKLQDLFEKTKTDGGNRKVTYKVFHPEWFVVSGEEQGRAFYTRVAASQKGLSGYTFSYRLNRKAELDRVTIAIANSFEPFRAAATSTTAVEAPPVLGFAASGLVIAPGKVLTVASVSACPELSVGMRRARLARADKALGLALLDVAHSAGVAALGLSAKPPISHDALVVIGLSALNGSPIVSVAPGEAVVVQDRLRVVAGLQRGAAGSAIFDRAGALAGIVADGGGEPRMVAGIVPQASHPAIGPAEIVAFLSAAEVSPAGRAATRARSTGEIASSVSSAVVAVECGANSKR